MDRRFQLTALSVYIPSGFRSAKCCADGTCFGWLAASVVLRDRRSTAGIITTSALRSLPGIWTEANSIVVKDCSTSRLRPKRKTFKHESPGARQTCCRTNLYRGGGQRAVERDQRSPKPPSPDINEGRTEKIVWVNEGNGVAAIAGTPFKIRKCADNKFVVEYNGQALSGGFYPPHRRVIPIEGDVHTLPVCQQVNESEDLPADFFCSLPTLWQAEGDGIWLLVSNKKIKIHECKTKSWRGKEFALEYDGQTQSWEIDRWGAENKGEEFARKIQAMDPIYNVPEFARPRSNLPVCEQRAP